MIALNELLDNIDEFKEKYSALGNKYNLDVFVLLENERKQTQMQCEGLRAKCNKSCGEIAKLKMEGKDTVAALSEILRLDKAAAEQKRKLDRLGRAIDRKLRALRNLPDEVILKNQELEILEKSGTMSDKYLLLKSKISEKFDGNAKKYLKSLSSVLFEESMLPTAIWCKDAAVILLKDFETDEVFEQIKRFLSTGAKSVFRLCSAKTEKYSTDEYEFMFEDGQIKLKLVREYFTREFSIKYKNKAIDATKFVNQINIKIKR